MLLQVPVLRWVHVPDTTSLGASRSSEYKVGWQTESLTPVTPLLPDGSGEFTSTPLAVVSYVPVRYGVTLFTCPLSLVVEGHVGLLGHPSPPGREGSLDRSPDLDPDPDSATPTLPPPLFLVTSFLVYDLRPGTKGGSVTQGLLGRNRRFPLL